MPNKHKSRNMVHGRKGELNEYYQIDLNDHGLVLIAQKTQPARMNATWFTYIAHKNSSGMGGIRCVEAFEGDDPKEAIKALETMQYTIVQFLTL